LYDSFDLVAENIGQLSVMSDKEGKAPTEFTKRTKGRPNPQSAEKVPWRANASSNSRRLFAFSFSSAACLAGLNGFFSSAASLALRATYIASRLRQQSSHMPVRLLVLPPHFQMQLFICTAHAE
jgi:hypothetical protein